MTAITEISGAGSFARDHRCAKRFFWIAGLAECRTIARLLQSLHDHARNADRTLVSRVGFNPETLFRVELGVLRTESESAATDRSDAAPLAINHAEDLFDQILRGTIPGVADGTGVLVLDFRAALLQLRHAHRDALQHIERFESGDDDWNLVLLGDREVLLNAHD